MKMGRFSFADQAVPLFLLLLAAAAHASEGISYKFNQTGMKSAVDFLIQRYEAPLVYQPEHLKDIKVTASCSDCDTETAVKRLCAYTPIIWRKVGEQFILTAKSSTLGHLRGTITRKDTGQPASGVQVYLRWRMDEHGGRAARHTTTDENGLFGFQDLERGGYRLIAAGQGLAVKTVENVEVTPEKPVSLDLHLDVVSIPLQQMVVMPAYYEMMRKEAGAREIMDEEEITRSPHLADDLFRVVDNLPGVSSGDISPSFRIRGATKRDVLYLLDGAELRDPFHLKALDSGIASIVDSQSIGRMELLTGTFSAEYGDKMGGVLNLSSTEPAARRETSVGINFLNFRMTTEGMFNEDRGRYLATVRRGFLDIALDFVNESAPGVDENIDTHFDDIFLKVGHRLGDNHVLTGHVLYARDRFYGYESIIWNGERLAEDIWSAGRSAYTWVNLESVWTDRINSNMTLGTGNHKYNLTFDDDLGTRIGFVRNKQEFEFHSLRQDWTFAWREGHVLRWGSVLRKGTAFFDYANERIDLGSGLPLNQGTLDLEVRDNTWEWGAFFAERVQVRPNLTFELGLRYDRQSHTSDSQWSPRFHLAYTPSKGGTFKMGWGRYYQPQSLHELQVEDGITSYFPAELAEHLGMSYDHRLDSGLFLRGAAYLRIFSDPRVRFENFLDPTTSLQEVEQDRIGLQPDRAVSKGIELLAQKNIGASWSWILNYTLSKAEDEFGQDKIPRQWDQRHAIKGLLSYQYENTWQVALLWNWHTGWKVTPVEIETWINEEGELEASFTLGELYGQSLPDYHRVDSRVSRKFYFPKGRRLTLSLDVINLLNHRNIRSYDSYDIYLDAAGNAQINVETEDWISRLPSLGITYTF